MEIIGNLLKFSYPWWKCAEVELKSGENVLVAGTTNSGNFRKLVGICCTAGLLCRNTHSYYAPMREHTPREMDNLRAWFDWHFCKAEISGIALLRLRSEDLARPAPGATYFSVACARSARVQYWASSLNSYTEISTVERSSRAIIFSRNRKFSFSLELQHN